MILIIPMLINKYYFNFWNFFIHNLNFCAAMIIFLKSNFKSKTRFFLLGVCLLLTLFELIIYFTKSYFKFICKFTSLFSLYTTDSLHCNRSSLFFQFLLEHLYPKYYVYSCFFSIPFYLWCIYNQSINIDWIKTKSYFASIILKIISIISIFSILDLNRALISVYFLFGLRISRFLYIKYS